MNEIWTVGHWFYPEADFLKLIRSQQIEQIIDVRSYPGSRKNPQFGSERMEHWLPEAGVDYTSFTGIGGRKRRQHIDPTLNAGWQNDSFKNYADFMCMPEYEHLLALLISLTGTKRTAYMCGEPSPSRCHRSLISDRLTALGWSVTHILPEGKTQLHRLGAWGAKPVVGEGGTVTYPVIA